VLMNLMNKDQIAEMPSKKEFSRLTRCSWLQSTGWIIAAGAFSRMTAWAAAEISPVMDKLSNCCRGKCVTANNHVDSLIYYTHQMNGN